MNDCINKISLRSCIYGMSDDIKFYCVAKRLRLRIECMSWDCDQKPTIDRSFEFESALELIIN